jgi:opacity protein-like surface antigen
MAKKGFYLMVVLGLAFVGQEPARGDVSAYLAAVGFDEEASLNGGVGLGVRWGKSSRLIGGETSLMIARPTRDLSGEEESATAFFYEGRLLVNLPLGTPVKPFAGVGFGAITITSTDIPRSADITARQALDQVSKLQTNRALSYGAGARYALADKLDVRVDLRQYSVFSVKALAAQKLQERVEQQVGMALPGELVKKKTVQYNELSAGVNFRF